MGNKSNLVSNEVNSKAIKEHMNKVDNQFNIDEFKSYTRKMDKLNEIMIELRKLSTNLGRSISTFTINGDGKEFVEYFNEQNEINSAENKEYIAFMFNYVIQHQKELVDEMYDKLYLDREEVEETEKDK